MDLGLSNKVALVAGGSSGLGLATAVELAREGAHVAIGARDPDRLAAAERRLKEVASGRVQVTSVDITDRAAAARWVDEVAAGFGALHIVLVSGGSPPVGTASRFAPADYEAAVGQVLLPAVNLALAALPHLRAAGWGRICLIASSSVKQPIPGLATSNTARAGLWGWAKTAAQELVDDGITLNVACPGLHRTDRVVDTGFTGRMGDPADFGRVVAFLCSEPAGFVSGAAVSVDGASTLGLL